MKTLQQISDLGFPLAIKQKGKKNFEVHYGKQIKKFNDWKPAFEEFGYCLAHALELNGVLDR